MWIGDRCNRLAANSAGSRASERRSFAALIAQVKFQAGVAQKLADVSREYHASLSFRSP